jgi:aminopeptidase YwaD
VDWDGRSVEHNARHRCAVALLVLLAVASYALPATADTLGNLRRHVTYLASPELEGRAPGTAGDLLARDYIVAAMESIGLEPAGDDGFCSSFEAVTHVEVSRSATLRVGARVLAAGIDFIPAGFSDAVPFEGPALFAGYGIHRPDIGHDDYAGLELEGRVVIAFSGAPPHLTRGRELHHVPGAMPEAKAAYLLSRGARGLILINGPEDHGSRPDQRTDDLPTMRPARALSGFPVAHLTARMGQTLLSPAGLNLPELQRQLNQQTLEAFPELDLAIRGTFPIQRHRSTLYNCIGRLQANAATGEADGPELQPLPPIVLGAHYDGLGFGIAGTFHTHETAFHPGADDNASGIAVLLEVARTLHRRNNARARDVYFVALGGEEIGLRGSRRLAHQWRERQWQDRSDVPEPWIYVNLDMVGRLRNGRIFLASTDQQNRAARAVLRAAQTAQIALHHELPISRYSDHLAFLDAGFVAVNITTGRHGDYHMPSDTIDRIEWRGMMRLVVLLTDAFEDLARP